MENVVIGTDINAYNLSQFMNSVDPNNKIVILPDKSIKPNNTAMYKNDGYEIIRITSGTTVAQMLNLVKTFA